MRGWCPAGIALPEINSETIAAIVRNTGGNFMTADTERRIKAAAGGKN
jgi:hypothetical protein